MTTHSPHVGLQVHAAPLSNGLGWPMGTAQWDLAHSFDSPLVKLGSSTGVSILMSYGENPHYVKLPIFSEFMENSTKFMKNLYLTKWTQNQR